MGASRPWGLYKQLPALGFDCDVLTATLDSPAAVPGVVRVGFEHRPDRIKRALGFSDFDARWAGPRSPRALHSIVRAAKRAAAEVAAYPDFQAGWAAPAIAAGLQLLADKPFGVILSTSPPETAHCVAAALKRETGTPWVADLRDLWSDNYDYKWSSLRRMVDRRLEARVLGGADALVTVSEPLAHALRRRHRMPVYVVPNGFDPDDVVDPGAELVDTFTITYTGPFYPGKREPTAFFAGLQQAVAGGHIDRSSVKVRMNGRNVDEPWVRAAVAAHGLTGIVETGGLLPRAQALERQRESQILLALDWLDPRQAGVATGKIYEYLAARRPILSVGPPGGIVEGLLRETGAGRHCSDVAQIVESLVDSHREFQRLGHVVYRGDAEAAQRHDHVAMSTLFAQILAEVTGKPNRA
jgi:hypothetical protein